MTVRKPLVIISGTTQQIPDADQVGANGGIGRTTAGALVIGLEANSTSVEIGRAAALTTVKGNLHLIGNMSFLKETNHSLIVDSSTTLSAVGGNINLVSGGGAPGAGATAGANAGQAVIAGGDGGAGTGAALPGVGGAVVIEAGDAGANGGAGGAAGGNVVIDAGAGTGAALSGAINIGGTNAATIQIGNVATLVSVVGRVAGNIDFVPQADHTLSVVASSTVGVVGGDLTSRAGQGAAGSVATPGGGGGDANVIGGQGGVGGTTAAGGSGGQATVFAGDGGAAGSTTGAGGVGGIVTVVAGTGGAGTATAVAGVGGALNIAAGPAGANGGAGGAAGGAVSINAGAKSGAALPGSISVGNVHASTVQIGNVVDSTVTSILGSNLIVDTTLQLPERAADPGAVANSGLVYTKDVTGVTQLFYRDSAGTVNQLTPNSNTNILIQDNVANAFTIATATETYVNIATSNGLEVVSFGNVTTNPSYDFLGSGNIRLVNGNALQIAERVGDPTAFADFGLVYTKDVAAVTQLFYRDSAGTVTQLTPASGGSSTDIVITDNTTNAFRVRTATEEYVNISTVNGSEVMTFGNPTTSPTFNFSGTGTVNIVGNVLMNSNVTLGNASSDTIGFSGRVSGNLSFVQGANHSLRVDQSAIAGSPGGNLNVLAAEGGNGSGATSGGTGGQTVLQGGLGGDGTATAVAGAGGLAVVQGGDAGTAAAGGGNNGGSVTVNAGAPSGAGTTGTIGIGDTGASAIQIGNNTNNTVVTFPLGTGTAVFTGTGSVRLTGGSAIEILERAADPANVANSGLVYTKDVAGITELFYRDSTGVVTQITPVGGGGSTDILIADNTANAFRVREGANEYVHVSTVNGAEAVTFGNATTNPTFTFSGFVAGDIGFVRETNHNLVVAASTTIGVVGGNLNLSGGQGANGSGATAGADGGAGRTLGGNGGNGGTTGAGGVGGAATLLAGSGGGAGSTSGAGGQGGVVNVVSGDGAAGTAAAASGSGGDVNITAGAAGADGGAGGAFGGNIIITAGTSEGVFASGGDVVVTSGTPNGLGSGGGGILVTASDATTGDATFSGGTGGVIGLTSGRGGNASGAQPAGEGGRIDIFGNNGGTGTATQSAGPGGQVELAGGDAGANGGGGGAAGGAIVLSPGDSTNGTGAANVRMINGGAFEMVQRPADPTAVANSGMIYTKDVAGVTKLFYIDNAGTVSQISP